MLIMQNDFTKMWTICPKLLSPKASEILLSGLERLTHGIMAEETHRTTVFLYKSSGEGKGKVWPRKLLANSYSPLGICSEQQDLDIPN